MHPLDVPEKPEGYKNVLTFWTGNELDKIDPNELVMVMDKYLAGKLLDRAESMFLERALEAAVDDAIRDHLLEKRRKRKGGRA